MKIRLSPEEQLKQARTLVAGVQASAKSLEARVREACDDSFKPIPSQYLKFDVEQCTSVLVTLYDLLDGELEFK
jgi:hypothetical protein